MITPNQMDSNKKYVFRKNTNIGVADASDDRKFLEQCFINNGDLDILRQMDAVQSLVVGRTGSGKTALIEQLNRIEERVVQISPEGLALNYISSNKILRFVMEAGVNLELFYRLLWRHVFAVELIRQRYQIVDEAENFNFWERIKSLFNRDPKKKTAIEYLREHGPSFWKDSDVRIQEVTKRIESELEKAFNAQASPSILGIKGELGLNIGSANKLTEEERAEVIHLGQEVVNKVQIQTLAKVIEMLEDDFLDDKKKRYYITIDRLDENWIDDEFRYGLIKALIETVRDFNRDIRNVKIIVALREDLLDRVFRYRSAGYQEEKYVPMYLRLVWSKNELESILDTRVNQLIKEQYTTQLVKLVDLFPTKIHGEDPLAFFFDRTLMRPRDAIVFFNECIRAAEGQTKFTVDTVKQAEVAYSETRLRALADEWAADYGDIFDLALFLKGYPSQFCVTNFHDKIEENLERFLNSNRTQDWLYNFMWKKFETSDIDGLTKEIMKIFFRIGLIGIKSETSKQFVWAHLGQRPLTGEPHLNSIVKIHPAFWQILGIHPEKNSW